MSSPELSTIAQLLYSDLQTLDFARIVAELDAVLMRLRGSEVEITWDCDDLVTFDVPETRILLAWSETGKRGIGGCLTVSVGPNPAVDAPRAKADHDVLCSRLVEKIEGRFAPESVLWHQMQGPVGSEYVDDLIDALPEVGGPTLPPIDSILDALSRADLHMADLTARPPHPRSTRAPELSRLAMGPQHAVEDEVKLAPPVKAAAPRPILVPATMMDRVAAPGFAEAANDWPDLPKPKSAELARLRLALYPVEEVAEQEVVYSTQMRLAAHCMNATLIVVYAPLGAAVMTYSLLRGEDMRLSSRMMAVAGTLFALAHSPVGETMAAMAKGMV
jgi:hypothetical protein